MIFYWSCFAIAFLFLLWVLFLEERINIFQCLTTIMVIIANGGWIVYADAQTLKEVSIGIKLTYAGGIFVPVLLFFTVCEICRIYLKKWCVALMLTLQVILYMFVCTIGHNGLFYAGLDFDRVAGMTVVEKTYGPFHTVYLATLFGYFSASVVIAILSMNRKNAVSFSNCVIILAGEGIGVGTYTTERILGLDFDVMPFAFILLSILVYTAMHKVHKYDVSNNSAIVKQMVNTSVYIAFDHEQGYESCNDHALEVFPELKTAALEKKLPDDSKIMEYFGRDLAKFILSVENKVKAGEVKHDGRIYECSFFKQGRFAISKAIVLEMNDVTEERRYVNMLKNYNKDLTSEVENKTKKINEIKDSLQKYVDYYNEASLNNACSFLAGKFFDTTETKTYKDVIMSFDGETISLNQNVKELFSSTNNDEISKWINEYIEYALLRYDEDFGRNDYGFPFLKPYAKYCSTL